MEIESNSDAADAIRQLPQTPHFKAIQNAAKATQLVSVKKADVQQADLSDEVRTHSLPFNC